MARLFILSTFQPVASGGGVRRFGDYLLVFDVFWDLTTMNLCDSFSHLISQFV